MDTLELQAEPREVIGRHVKYLRRDGWTPAVLYGQDFETIPLQIEAKSLRKVLRQAGTHQLISLKIGNQKPHVTLARDIQRDVIKNNYLHVDFYAVKMDQKVSAQVPLLLVGEAPATDEKGGILTQGLDQLEIECLPSDLIATIEVSVEGLTDFHDSITVADLDIPDTITIISEPESVVAKIEPPRMPEELEAELEEAVAPVEAEPELISEAEEEGAAEEVGGPEEEG
jgi:large subunit ribosomal protein L25